MMTKVTELHTYGKRFIIAHDEHGYWGIGEEFTDGGKFTRRINGLQGHLSPTIADCIKACQCDAHMEALMQDGMTMMDAVRIAYNC